MRPRWLWAGLLAGFMPLAFAAENDARGWLARMSAAASGLSYQGTLVFSAGGEVSSSRVWHYRVGADSFERLESQDGQQMRIYRHNDEVRTVWPQTGLAVVERRETLAAWSTTPQAVDSIAAGQYTLKQEGSGRIAGRDAAILLLMPRDNLRFAQRLWADKASGLMLRADVLSADSALLESSAFSVVELEVKPQPDSVKQALRQDEGLRVVRPPQRRTTLEAEGWRLSRPVPGFALSGCVVKGVEAGGKGPPMLQAVFSDGLTHVSVFVEPFDPVRHRAEVQARRGATHTAMRRIGDDWFTVVGDVPSTSLKQFAEALERQR